MEQRELLKILAKTGYNIGFGAKKHFATFDIVGKVPGWIGYITLVFGIFGLFFDQLSVNILSVLVVLAGISAIYCSCYLDNISEYEQTAKKLTQMFNEVRDLYFEVKADSVKGDSAKVDEAHKKLKEIEKEFYEISTSKQILFSDILAHFKFFGQFQIDWIDDELKFRLWKDKVPISVKIWIWILISALVLVPIIWAIPCAVSLLESICSR